MGIDIKVETAWLLKCSVGVPLKPDEVERRRKVDGLRSILLLKLMNTRMRSAWDRAVEVSLQVVSVG